MISKLQLAVTDPDVQAGRKPYLSKCRIFLKSSSFSFKQDSIVLPEPYRRDPDVFLHIGDHLHRLVFDEPVYIMEGIHETNIICCARTEYDAGAQTENFYRSIWIPFCRAKGIFPSAELWQVPQPSFEKWLSQFPKNYWYPWGYFGQRFDRYTAERLAYAAFSNGNLDEAIDKYGDAIKLGSHAFYRRALVEMAGCQWDSALADLEQSKKVTPKAFETGIHGPIFVWLIQRREGNVALANSNLESWRAAHTSQKSWMWDISEFLLGRMSKEELLDASASDDITVHEAQYCEAFYYVGEKDLLDGDKNAAIEAFTQCSRLRRTETVEYALAQMELRTLK